MITGPSFSSVDVSFFKNNRIHRFGEQANLQFRAEAFNILNHTNFAPPSNNNQQLYDGTLRLLDPRPRTGDTGGVLTSTAGNSRQLQFAAKFTF